MGTRQEFGAALEQHRSGNLEQARALYRRILKRHPQHADALHLLGLIAFQSGEVEEAVQLVQSAIRIHPSAALYYCNLGCILRAQARTSEAVGAFRRAVELEPDYVEAHLYLGDLLVERDCDEALACYSRALRIRPDRAEAHLGLGNARARKGGLAEAEACYRQALSLKPDFPEALNNLGNALREQGRLEEAMPFLQRALELKPDFPEAALNLAAVLEAQGRVDDAAACLEQLAALEPENARALNNLGSVCKQQGRLEEAQAHLEKALRLQPDFVEARSNLGAAFEHLGEPERAISCYREALRVNPDFAEAHLNLGMALLLTANFEEGWKEYEWRWKVKGQPPRRFRQPLWDGSALEGRRILLYAEQGLGDAIHFVRYAPLVKARGGTVLLECPWRLVPLFKSVRGVDRLIPASSSLPEFDCQAPLLSLPGIFRTTLENVPAEVPYLAVPADCVERRRREVQATGAGGLRVGLCWASNASGKNVRFRSMSLEDFAPLAALTGLALFGLQRGPQVAQLRRPPARLSLTNLEEEAGSVLDTAAAILNLDLVITVDTMVAHLAGALAVPVWTLLPFAPDFRWMLARRDSPWYPTMRLFRQPRPGDWAAVVADVCAMLRQRCATGGEETREALQDAVYH